MMHLDDSTSSASNIAGEPTRFTADAVFLWQLVCALLGGTIVVLSRGSALGTQDFRCFYAAGQMLRHCHWLLYDLNAQYQWQRAAAGGNVLLPFYHLAYEALLYVPFTLFSYKTAYLAYAVWNMLLLWLCYRVSPRGSSIFAGTKRPALFFLSFPPLLCVFVGENALLVLFALLLAYNAIRAGLNRRAGVLLGLITFKLAIVAPLAFLITIRHGRRFLGGFFLGSVPVLAVSFYIAGVNGTRAWLRMLGSATLVSGQRIEDQHKLGVWLHAMPNLTGLLYLFGSRHLAAHAAFALNLAILLVVIGIAAYIQRCPTSEALAFSTALVCTLLVAPHLFIYDFCSLVLPFLLLSHRWLKYVAVLWFLEPPVLYAIGFLTWFAPAVVIPLLLLAICVAEFRRQPAGGNMGARPEFA